MNFTRLLVIALITNLWFAEDAYPAYPYTLSERYANGDGFMRVRLLGALELPFSRLNGHDLVELSGLAWDHDEQMLYAISDHGHLFHLRPTIEQEFLTEVEVLDAFSLDAADGSALSGAASDAEGLAIVNGRNGRQGDTELVISFERLPRINRYTPTGELVHQHQLPRVLEQAYRGSNSGFESVTFLPSTGILTGPERPIENPQSEVHSLFDLNGKRWTLPRFPAPNSALVAIEAMPDESLITLERSFVSVWQPLRIILRQTTPLSSQGGPVSSEDLVVFNSYDGWRIDNFEGLTRHEGMRFFLVSDDNENAMQRTLLIYLEILDTPATQPADADER